MYFLLPLMYFFFFFFVVTTSMRIYRFDFSLTLSIKKKQLSPISFLVQNFLSKKRRFQFPIVFARVIHVHLCNLRLLPHLMCFFRFDAILFVRSSGLMTLDLHIGFARFIFLSIFPFSGFFFRRLSVTCFSH